MMPSLLLIPAGLALALLLAAILLTLVGLGMRRLPLATRGSAALCADRLLLGIAGALSLAAALAACVVGTLVRDCHLVHHIPHLCIDGLLPAPAGRAALLAVGGPAGLAVAGACFHAWRAFRRQHRCAQAIRRAGIPLPVPAEAAAERAAHRLGVSFAGLSQVDIPGRNAFVLGLRHPCCILTRSLVERLSPAEVEAVVAHEAAHLRRGDPLARLLLAACRRLFGPIAPVRSLLRAWGEAAEMAADDLAAGATGCRLELASALLAAARVEPALGPALVEGSAALVTRRVERLLAPAPASVLDARQRSIGIAVATGLVAGILLAAISSPLLPSLHCLVENLIRTHTLCPR